MSFPVFLNSQFSSFPNSACSLYFVKCSHFPFPPSADLRFSVKMERTDVWQGCVRLTGVLLTRVGLWEWMVHLACAHLGNSPCNWLNAQKPSAHSCTRDPWPRWILWLLLQLSLPEGLAGTLVVNNSAFQKGSTRNDQLTSPPLYYMEDGDFV